MTKSPSDRDGVRVAVWFQGSPWPVRSGVQARVADAIAGLREAGADVRLFSTGSEATAPWTDEAFETARRQGVSGVELAPSRSFLERVTARSMSRWNPERLLYRWSFPSTTRWLREQIDRWDPEVLWFNHVTSARLCSAVARGRRRTVLEMLDLLGMNLRMSSRLEWFARAPEVRDPRLVPGRLLELSCFDDVEALCRAERSALAGFDEVISISPKERDVLVAGGIRAPRYLPATASWRSGSEGDANPLFPTGPNRFNLQGYAWFVNLVLPRILQSCPSFELDVCGSVCERFLPVPGVRHLGTVPDFEGVLDRSRFCVVPVWGGTGQQLKIVQAQAAGKAVVTIRQKGRFDAPVVEGLLDCEDVEGFACACVELWNDRGLRQAAGMRARQVQARMRSEHAPAAMARAILGTAR